MSADDHELIAAHGRLAGDLVGIDVDQLDHPVGVGAAGGGDQVGDRLSADLHRRGQDVGDEGHDVRAAGRLALVVHQPLRPGEAAGRSPWAEWGARGRARAWRDRRRTPRTPHRRASARSKLSFRPAREIERRRSDRAAARAAGGPGGQAPPRVRPGLERRDGRHVGLGRAVLQVLVQERAQDLPAEVERGVAVEFQSAPSVLPSPISWP